MQLPERDAIAIEGEALDRLGLRKPGEFAVFVREEDGLGLGGNAERMLRDDIDL